MNILFVHQNFPGQYRSIAPIMAKHHTVVALADKVNISSTVLRECSQVGINVVTYKNHDSQPETTHHYVDQFEAAVRRGQASAQAALQIKKKGFIPDVVCAHPGWGDALYLRDIFPDSLHLYLCEFYYRTYGSDFAFDPEFPTTIDDAFRVRTKNATLLLSMDAMDRGVSPTYWQRGQHPPQYQESISVIHEGIDTKKIRPDPNATVTIDNSGTKLTSSDPVVTFVARTLEPVRGIHQFIRSLPAILQRNPHAHVIVVGSERAHYEDGLGGQSSLLNRYWAEVEGRVDTSRVHFLGTLDYRSYLSVLQISSAHIYLTYPFVLSWSMLEAMAAGSVVVGSATPPVEEVVEHEDNGLLVDFFDPDAIAEGVTRVLQNPLEMENLRRNGRRTVVEGFDLETVCVPRYRRMIEGASGE